MQADLDLQAHCLDKLLFSCEIVDCGKSSVSIFQEFYASIAKIFILEGWAPGYNSIIL